MGKNILELFKDQIDGFEQTDNQLKINRSLLLEKANFPFDLSQQLITRCCLFGWKDEKPLFKKFESMKPTLKSYLRKADELFESHKFSDPSDPIERHEFFLQLYFNPTTIYESIVNREEPFKQICDITGVRKKIIDIFKLFLSDKYPIVTTFKDMNQLKKTFQHKPYTIDLYQQLLTISTFYYTIFNLKTLPVNIILKIDSIFTQLAFEVSSFLALSPRVVDWYYRIERGKTKKRKIKAERKQPVIEAYYRIDRDGLSFHGIAKAIKKYLDSIQKNPPSIDTIKRYLKQENLI